MEDAMSFQKREFGKELDFIHEGLNALKKAGISHTLWNRLIKDRELAKEVVGFIKRSGYEESSSQRQAREIMDRNFLGIEEIAEHFGIFLTKEELMKVAEIPFTERTLQECKDTHILFLGVSHDKEGKPLTINCFREMFPIRFRFELSPIDSQPEFLSYQAKSWYDKEKFVTKETVELQWYLIRKSILEGSESKTFSQQEKLFKKQECRERAIVYVYGILLMFRVTGENLFENDYVLCKDTDSHGNWISVGGSDLRNGIDINPVSPWWDSSGSNRIVGLAPARKFEL